MQIENILWLEDVVDKLQWKHRISTFEVEEVLKGNPYIAFKEKGRHYLNEDVYIALGKTEAGRYIFILFIYKANRQTLILTARNMTQAERKLYERKKK